jgi:hypothetical protein
MNFRPESSEMHPESSEMQAGIIGNAPGIAPYKMRKEQNMIKIYIY